MALCETGGTLDPYAVGGQGERGPFQIHPIHFGRFDAGALFEPTYNAEAAYALYLDAGPSPWRRCWP